jgi:hypothetical protein
VPDHQIAKGVPARLGRSVPRKTVPRKQSTRSAS